MLILQAPATGSAPSVWVPIGIAGLSLLVASFALGWNVYRDVVLKARVRVRFGVWRVVRPGAKGPGDQYLKIDATNHGPGPVRLEMIVGKYAPPSSRITRRMGYFVLMADYSDPLNSRQLPYKLEVGDTLSQVLPYDDLSVLNSDATHVGISDSFGRSHYAPRSDLLRAREQFAKDFPNPRPIKKIRIREKRGG